MPSATKALLLPLLALTPVAGCSDQAAVEQKKVSQQFDAAVATFDQAQSGYVPHHGKAPANLQAADLEDYRQTQLTTAVQQLQPLLDKGSDRQQLSVRRLLADADLSNADRLSHEATAAWAGVTRDSSGLLSEMIAVDSAGARAKLFDTAADEGRSLLDQANQDVTAAQSRQAQAEKNVAELEPKIADLQSKIKALQQEQDAATTESHSLFDKAFIGKGDEQAALYRQSDAAQRKADIADAEARRDEIGLDRENSEMAIATKLLSLARDATKTVEAHARAAEDRLNQAKTNEESALSRKQKATELLDKKFADAAKAYADSVESVFTAAEEKASHAVDVLTQGVPHAHGDDLRSLQMDLLGARVSYASILTQHAVSAASFHKTLALLAGQAERSMPGKTIFSETAKHTQSGVNTAYSQGKNAVEDGLKLAAELAQSGGSDPDLMTTLSLRREILSKYGATLTATQTGDAPAPETPQ